ncbi:hypothetical protein CY35_13G091500 [Sphagnum magellanicum]|nr:hypothetical protein CY35_13G091500 [Sphagnum magellanicum]
MYGLVEELYQGVDFNKGATSPRYGEVEELHQGADGWRSFTTAIQIWSLRLERFWSVLQDSSLLEWRRSWSDRNRSALRHHSC